MEDSKSMRRRDLPPIPQRQRTLPPMPSQDAGEDTPAPKGKKKKSKKQANGVDDENPAMEMVGGRMVSESREPLTPEPANDGPPQRRRRKKKTPSIDLEDDQAELVNGDGPEMVTDGEEVVKKPKKKKKPRVTESQLPNELDVEEDDIITDAQPPGIPQHALFTAPQGQSQSVGKLFVERNKRFQAAERSVRRKPSDLTDHFMDFQPSQPLWTTRDVSMRVHGGFRVLGLFCHGLLAGYAIWNIVVVYVLAGQQLTALSNLLQQYHSLAYPSQSLLYLLLSISTVAAFDRVNLAKGTVALREFATLDPVALASFYPVCYLSEASRFARNPARTPTTGLLYFTALILSLSQQMTSDRINLYHSSNGTLWPAGSEHQILHPWVTVNLVVALLVGLAWIFISTRPEMDYTEGYLMAMEIATPKTEEKTDISA